MHTACGCVHFALYFPQNKKFGLFMHKANSMIIVETGSKDTTIKFRDQWRTYCFGASSRFEAIQSSQQGNGTHALGNTATRSRKIAHRMGHLGTLIPLHVGDPEKVGVTQPL